VGGARQTNTNKEDEKERNIRRAVDPASLFETTHPFSEERRVNFEGKIFQFLMLITCFC